MELIGDRLIHLFRLLFIASLHSFKSLMNGFPNAFKLRVLRLAKFPNGVHESIGGALELLGDCLAYLYQLVVVALLQVLKPFINCTSHSFNLSSKSFAKFTNIHHKCVGRSLLTCPNLISDFPFRSGHFLAKGLELVLPDLLHRVGFYKCQPLQYYSKKHQIEYRQTYNNPYHDLNHFSFPHLFS